MYCASPPPPPPSQSNLQTVTQIRRDVVTERERPGLFSPPYCPLNETEESSSLLTVDIKLPNNQKIQIKNLSAGKIVKKMHKMPLYLKRYILNNIIFKNYHDENTFNSTIEQERS